MSIWPVSGWRLAVMVLLCVGLTQCSKEKPIVAITVLGLQSEVRALRPSVSLNQVPSKSSIGDIEKDLQQFTLQLPEQAAGTVGVDLEAIDNQQGIVAVGHGELNVTGPGYYAMSITLGTEPMPVIRMLTPSTISAGQPGFSLLLEGTGLSRHSQVRFAETTIPGSFLSSMQLTITVPAAAIAAGREVPVVVVNPSPGGGQSAAVPFIISNPKPQLTMVSPAGATAGGPQSRLTIKGSGFVTTSQARFGEQSLVTHFISGNELAVDVPASLLTTVRAVDIAVVNGPPAGGASNAVSFAIEPIVLAAAQNNPYSIAVDSQFVYWTNNADAGSVMRVPISGGKPEPLAPNEVNPSILTIDSTTAYWTSAGENTGTVRKVSLAGGAQPVLMARDQTNPLGIAVDVKRGYIYWANYYDKATTNGFIMRVPIDMPLMSSQLSSAVSFPKFIAIDETSLYFTSVGNAGHVRQMSITGGSTGVVTDFDGSAEGIAIDDRNVYWADPLGAVKQVSKKDRVIKVLAKGENGTIGVTVDANYVYWTSAWHNNPGFVRRAPIDSDGSKVETLAAGQQGPRGIAVDMHHVYWANYYGGTIAKIPKPPM